MIKDTFKLGVYYNDHNDSRQRHQPILVAVDEVVEDKELMWKLIESCWIQKFWSPSINPKGAFFCEVAAVQDLIFKGPGGYPVELGWWNKTPEEFRDQVERYCPMCGGALPFECPSNKETRDLVSPKNYERLIKVGSPKALAGRVEIYDKKMSREEITCLQKEWHPWDYLSGSLRKKDLKLDEILILKGVISPRQFIPLTVRHPCQALSLILKHPNEILNSAGIKTKSSCPSCP